MGYHQHVATPNINADGIMNVSAQDSRVLAKELVGRFMDEVYGEGQ